MTAARIRLAALAIVSPSGITQGYERRARADAWALLHPEDHDVLVLLGGLLVAHLVVAASLGAVLARLQLDAELELPLRRAVRDEEDRLAAVRERAEEEPVRAPEEPAVQVGAADLGHRHLDALDAAGAGLTPVARRAAQRDGVVGHT